MSPLYKPKGSEDVIDNSAPSYEESRIQTREQEAIVLALIPVLAPMRQSSPEVFTNDIHQFMRFLYGDEWRG